VSTRRGGRGSAPRVMHGREERDRSHRARCVCRSKTRGMDPCARRCEEAPTTMTPQSLISATSNQEICPRWRRTRRRTYARDSSDPLLAAAFDPHATSSTRRECPRHSRWASSRGRGAFTRASRSHRRGVEPRIDVLRRRHTPLAPSSRASPHVRLPPRPIVALSGGLHPVMTTTHVVVVAHRSAWHPP